MSTVIRLILASAISIAVSGCAQVYPNVPITVPAPRSDGARADGQTQIASSANATPQPQAAQANPTAAPTSVAPSVRMVPVRLGHIADVVLLNGRVAGVDEAPLSFSSRGTVERVFVEPGQAVTEGQILVQSDAKQLEKDMTAARSKAEAAAETLARAQQQAMQHRATAIANAEARLHQARTDLDKVLAGSPASDRNAADAAVLAAQTNLDRSAADLAKASAPPDPVSVRNAQRQVSGAQIALQAAQADQAKLQAGPDPAAVRDAERAVANADTNLMAVQADFDAMTRGPDPYEMRAAERAVQQAQFKLDDARALQVSKTFTAAQRDSAVNAARLGLQDAQDRLDKLKEAPSSTALQLAQRKIDDARVGVAAAQDQLESLRKGPDQVTLDRAQSAVDSAQAALDIARASLAAIQSQPSQEQITLAQAAYEAAKLALKSAEARQTDVYGHPTPAELNDARTRVLQAQQALDRERNVSDSGADGGLDIPQLQRAVEVAKAEVSDAQRALDASHLVAPYSAAVAQVLVQAGDVLEAGRPSIILARSADPVVRVNLLDGAKPKRVEVGQSVSVQLDESDDKFDGQVAEFSEPASNGDRIAVVPLNWGVVRPKVGTGARVTITLAAKDAALLVPRRAVRVVANKTYLEVADGVGRKMMPVEIGITTPTDVEIVSGASQGQNIVVDSVLDAPSAEPRLPPPIPAPVVTDLLVADSFGDNRQTWPNNPQGTAWLADGVYHLFARHAARYVGVSIPRLRDLGDVVVTASFHKVGGPAGGGFGLILRDQLTEPRDGLRQDGRFYVFEVGDKGEFGVWLRSDDRWVDLVPWTPSNAVKPGTATNELTVAAAGDKLSFTVNGVLLTTQIDSQLRRGAVGLFAGGDGNQVTVDRVTVSAPRSK